MKKFDKVIESLRMAIGEIEYEWSVAQPQGLKAEQELYALVEQHEQVIAILESYPKWEPLIEAAKKLIEMVETQAKDEGLWFRAETAPEAYLQRELRKLHAAIESIPEEK